MGASASRRPCRAAAGLLALGLVGVSCASPSGGRRGTAPEPGTDDPPGARRAILEEMLEDRGARRDALDGGGRAWLAADGERPEPAHVDRARRWTIVYEAGPGGILEGGAIRFIAPPFWFWSPPQTFDPDLPGFTTAATDAAGVELRLTAPSFVDIRVTGRALREGERVRIVYGAGDALAAVDRYAEHGSRFWIGVDGDGDGTHALLEDSPSVDVEPSFAARLLLLLPSTARPGESVTLRLAVLDRWGNAGVPFRGVVELSADPPLADLPRRVALEPGERGVKVVQLEVDRPGIFRVDGRSAVAGGEVGLSARSNPLLVSEGPAPILWGDLHGHSALSDGTGTAEDYFRYARDVAGLDIAALTDHDHWGFLFLDDHPELWREIRDTARRFDDPGRFVALSGYEWTNWIHGHRHVLYFRDDGRLLSSLDPAYATPDQLWDALRGEAALTVAHHSAGGPIPTNWAFPPDPELEPVTEICSVHGSSEAPDSPFVIYDARYGNFVRDMLERGYRFGFLGSGDSHDGHPGLAHLAGGGGGLAAILADELTRESVYRAIRGRRTYATNGPRILLRAALQGAPMGSLVDAPEPGTTATLYVRVIACGPLERIDLVRRGRVDRSVPCGGSTEWRESFELADLEPGDYVYVRAVQIDGGAAWSSPFFLN